MSTRQQKSFKALAVFLAFAVAQVFVQLSFAQAIPRSFATVLPQQFMARLTTTGNAPISVNGASASTGATLLTGALIETPPSVGATIDLGPIGTLDLAPGAKIKLEFDCAAGLPENSQNCKAKVTVLAGCVVAHGKQGSNIQIDTEQQGNVGDSNKKADGLLNFCFGPATAGAGAAATGAGIGTGAKVAIAAATIGTVGVIAWALTNGGTPSGSTP